MKQLRSKVGLVFQYPEHQLFEVDVLTDVCFGPKNQGLGREEAEARAKKALEQVGLDPSYYKQSPFELSGGQKRRVAIAGVLSLYWTSRQPAWIQGEGMRFWTRLTGSTGSAI